MQKADLTRHRSSWGLRSISIALTVIHLHSVDLHRLEARDEGSPTKGYRLATNDRFYDWSDVAAQAKLARSRVQICGPLTVARVLYLRGHLLDAKAWQAWCEALGGNGASLEELQAWCRRFERYARIERATRRVQAHPQSIQLPWIAIVNNDAHCLVVESISSDLSFVTVWDPADLQSKRLSWPVFCKQWQGMMLTVAPSHRWSNAGIIVYSALLVTCIGWWARRRSRLPA